MSAVPFKPECIPDAFRTSENLAALSSLLLNTMLVVVVIRCKASELQTYSKLILCNCFADSLFAMTTYVAEIHADLRGGMLVVINKGFDLGMHPFAPLTFYLFALYFAVIVVAFPIAYRYLAICRNYRLSGPQLVGCFLLVAALASIVPTILESSPPCLVASVVINVTYATVVFCAYKVHRFLQCSSFGTNPARQILQRQIGWALMAQAITPMFVIVLPLGAVIVVTITGAEGLHSVIVSGLSFCAWIPVVNPMFTIYFIKPYRHVLFGRLIAKWPRSRIAATTVVTAGSFQPASTVE